MHFVLIRFSSLGDIILQTPLLSYLKYHFPSCKISFVTLNEYKSLLLDHPYVDEVITHSRQRGLEDIKSLRALAKNQLEAAGVDVIIDLHNTMRGKILRFFAASIPSLVVDKRPWPRKLLVWLKIDLLKRQESHHSRMINDFAFIFGKKFDRSELEQFNREQTGLAELGLTTVPASFTKVPKKIAGDYIVISPVASFAPKRWPMSRVRELIQKILMDKDLVNYSVVIVAGPGDTYIEEIFEAEDFGERVINLQGKTSITESSEIIAGSKLCLTNDTGSAHMAEAFGVKSLVIFGPTSESFGFRPHLEGSMALSTDVWCRPCSTTGKAKCWRKQQYCMLNLEADMVYQKLKSMLDIEV